MAIREESPAQEPSAPAAGLSSSFLENPLAGYAQVRFTSEWLCEPLETEDYGLQSEEVCSPAKWHLAHTTWFFETFILRDATPGYEVFNEHFGYLFNSYYESVGRMHPRPRRGLLSRPTVSEVYAYRRSVDEAMLELLEARALTPDQLANLELGLYHEQQHQELILTDLKHGFSCNPMKPAYRTEPHRPASTTAPMHWVDHPGGVARIGHRGEGFSFDNEGPSHRVFLEPHSLASRLVTCGEYLEFMADGGYQRPELWLSKGWERIQSQGWEAPLYWSQTEGRWTIFTLDGVRNVDRHEPVCHVSLYEADAFARWTGFRLATEFEWEVACAQLEVGGNFLDTKALHPRAADEHEGLVQGFGDVWEWTGSAYAAYPAYRAPAGALGEYNGKFMCSQTVLRGGSCATPASHLRATYRNFFYPEDRWQFSGIRLARDL